MTEKEILISCVFDKKISADKNSMITFTSFLSVDEKSDIIHLEKNNSANVRTYYYGGYENSERSVAVFVPSFYDNYESVDKLFEEYDIENPVTLIRVKKDRFSALSHRDYLGALMGMGLKRDVIGDILPIEDGCYIFCLSSIAEYIVKNLTSVGRGTIECTISDTFSISEYKEIYTENFLSVASLRLDNVVSAAFNISRSEAAEKINSGIVYVNSVRILKNNFQINLNDKIVVRGKGKTVLSEINGQSKKGRIHITVKKYK